MEKQNFYRYRILTSKFAMIISGIACAIPFIFDKMFVLSWIMYAPLALSFFDKEQSLGCYVKKAFLFSFGYYFTGYLWLAQLYPLDFAGLDRFQSVAVIVIALSVVPALHGMMFTFSASLCFAVSRKFNYIFGLAMFPCTVVFAELFQSIGIFAFPWCRVAVTQTAFSFLFQSVSLLGAYFLAYVVVLSSALIALFLKTQKKIFIIAALLVFVVNATFGLMRITLLKTSFQNGESFAAAAVQGNFPSNEKWSGSITDMAEVYLNLAKEAAESFDKQEELLVLTPETALPVTFTKNSARYAGMMKFALDNNITLALGAFHDGENGTMNAVYIFSPTNEDFAPYGKRHLVPFGEYVPYRAFFETVFPPLAEINLLSSDIAKAGKTAVFETRNGKIGTLICYESIFSNLCRDSIKDGAEIIIIPTNDSWFGESCALKHHLAQARIRAAEFCVPVIRAGNTGISALINPDGSVAESLGANKRGFISGCLPYGTGTTLYEKLGELWLIVCIAYTAFLGLFSIIKIKNNF